MKTLSFNSFTYGKQSEPRICLVISFHLCIYFYIPSTYISFSSPGWWGKFQQTYCKTVSIICYSSSATHYDQSGEDVFFHLSTIVWIKKKVICKASAPLEMHAGCITTVCRRLQDAATCMQEVARCSSLHAACMQVACSLHYASSVAASIEIQGFDALHPGVNALHTGIDALHAGCMQGVDAKKIRREWTCYFSAYFSERIFLFLAYDSMLWCHRDVTCRLCCVYCLHRAKKWRKRGWTLMFTILLN